MARYVGRSSVCCQQNKYVIEARAGQPAFAFFVRKFFAVQYRCIFCRETATLSTTSVKAKIRESFLPVQFCGKFVLKSVAHSVATKYVGRSSVCCQQNKYVIEARAGQPAFSFNPHLQASGKHLLFFGKEVIIKIINKGKRLSVEIPLTYARTE